MPASLFAPGAVELFVGLRLTDGGSGPPQYPDPPTLPPDSPPNYTYPYPPYQNPTYPPFDPVTPSYTPPSSGGSGGSGAPTPGSGGVYGSGSGLFTPSGGSGGTGGQSPGVQPTYFGGGEVNTDPGGGGDCHCNLNTHLWAYLGSAVVAPDVEATVFHTPISCDLNAPDAFQLVFNSESHLVTATLNRLNWRVYNSIRNDFLGDGAGISRIFQTGNLVLHDHDFLLFVRYALPSVSASFAPDGLGRGRLYFSSVVSDYHETAANGRVQEATLLFQCKPLWCRCDRLFYLFTEEDAALPILTPE